VRRILIALALLSPICVHAAEENKLKLPKEVVVVTNETRASALEWDVKVDVEQDAIGTSIDIGRVMPNSSGGGLIGALIIDSRYDNRKPIASDLKANAEIAADIVRISLKDFNADAVAEAAARKAILATPWIKLHTLSVVKRSPAEARAVGTDSKSLSQALLVLRYEFSPDFTQIRVVANLLMDQAERDGPHLVAYMPMVSTVQLRDRAFDVKENAAIWARDNGALAHRALSQAFAGIERLMPRALSMTKADVNAWSSKGAQKSFAAGFNGAIVDRTSDNGVILWQNALVAVETIS